MRSARAGAERRDGLLESDREPPIKTRHRNGKRGIDGREARRERAKPLSYPPDSSFERAFKMTTAEVLAGSVGAGGRNDERDVKLVQRLPDDWRATRRASRCPQTATRGRASTPPSAPFKRGTARGPTSASSPAIRPGTRWRPITWRASARGGFGRKTGPSSRSGDRATRRFPRRTGTRRSTYTCGGLASGFEPRAPRDVARPPVRHSRGAVGVPADNRVAGTPRKMGSCVAPDERRIGPTPGGTAGGFSALRG